MELYNHFVVIYHSVTRRAILPTPPNSGRAEAGLDVALGREVLQLHGCRFDHTKILVLLGLTEAIVTSSSSAILWANTVPWLEM